MADLFELNERRFLGTLKALSTLLREFQIEKWADWFAGDLEDYLAAAGPPRQIARQGAVLEHVLMAFGGMSTFKQLELVDKAGKPSAEANKRLHFLAEQLWASARGLQSRSTPSQDNP